MTNLFANKKLTFIPKIVFSVMMVSGIALAVQGYFLVTKTGNEKIPNDNIVEIRMRAVKNEWRWEPDEIKVPTGSFVRLRIFNEDSHRHGFTIKELEIDRVLPAFQETVVEFQAPEEAGEYSFLCSVLCGQGHFKQKGVLIVY